MNKEDKRKKFERIVSLPSVLKYVKFPLQTMEINGQFHHYMDSDTDSAFMGFCLGMEAQKRLTQ